MRRYGNTHEVGSEIRRVEEASQGGCETQLWWGRGGMENLVQEGPRHENSSADPEKKNHGQGSRLDTLNNYLTWRAVQPFISYLGKGKYRVAHLLRERNMLTSNSKFRQWPGSGEQLTAKRNFKFGVNIFLSRSRWATL